MAKLKKKKSEVIAFKVPSVTQLCDNSYLNHSLIDYDFELAILASVAPFIVYDLNFSRRRWGQEKILKIV